MLASHHISPNRFHWRPEQRRSGRHTEMPGSSPSRTELITGGDRQQMLRQTPFFEPRFCQSAEKQHFLNPKTLVEPTERTISTRTNLLNQTLVEPLRVAPRGASALPSEHCAAGRGEVEPPASVRRRSTWFVFLNSFFQG